MPYAALKNKKGNFVKPTLASTSTAMNVALPDDMKVSLTDTDAPEGYPMAGLTWILVYKEQAYQGKTEAKAKEVVTAPLVDDPRGPEIREPMQYAPLSKRAMERAEALIKSITYNGKGMTK